MRIADKGTTIVVTPIDSVDVELAQEEHGKEREFLAWWAQRAQDYNAPRYRASGADRRIAARLLKRFDTNRLKKIAVIFWRQHSDPLISGEYNGHMILFSAKLAEAERDLDSIETTAIAD